MDAALAVVKGLKIPLCVHGADDALLSEGGDEIDPFVIVDDPFPVCKFTVAADGVMDAPVEECQLLQRSILQTEKLRILIDAIGLHFRSEQRDAPL